MNEMSPVFGRHAGEYPLKGRFRVRVKSLTRVVMGHWEKTMANMLSVHLGRSLLSLVASKKSRVQSRSHKESPYICLRIPKPSSAENDTSPHRAAPRPAAGPRELKEKVPGQLEALRSCRPSHKPCLLGQLAGQPSAGAHQHLVSALSFTRSH
jgi:hypothetical protein